jgi:tripartite-type tricarboxylate transporter receptor subunit TctC
MRPMVRAGKLRALTIFSARPDTILPEVPTLGQLGYKDVPLLVNAGIFLAPPNTPREIVNILEKAISKATADPGFLKLAENSGVIPDFKPSSEANKAVLECYELLNKYKQFIK